MGEVSIDFRDQLALITIDNPPVNALSQAVRSGLIDAIEEIELKNKSEIIILICGGRTFCAGADIREFSKPVLSPHLSEVITRIEACEIPIVAVIHGTALGGGLELAMGCHFRVADPKAKVGLPEVNLGLLPGAMGTQRLPRLIGVKHSLDMMISGKPVDANTALSLGILDQLIEEHPLLDGAISYANDLLNKGIPIRRVRDLIVEPVSVKFFDEYREKIAYKTRGLISPEKIIRCVQSSIEMDFDEAASQERYFFKECMTSPQSKALRHIFFAERAVTKLPDISSDVSQRAIKKVAVIGAGTMGSGIAYSALRAGYGVTLLDNEASGLDRGENSITGFFEHDVLRKRINESGMKEGLERLQTTQDFDSIANVDLVIEAVFENMAIKKDVFQKLDSICRDGAILATNTSTLDIDQIASVTKRPEDVVGLLFFSPAHIMRLLEIVRGDRTEDDVLVTALSFAKRLRKVGVVVGNCFGFVGNRMLHGYGREAQLLLLEGAPPEHIDVSLQNWGMAMGPHAVGDLAGLDVGYKIRQERTDQPDDPCFYRVADVLSEAGRFGHKTGKGMYLYESGSRSPIPDPEVQALIKREAELLGVQQREINSDEIIERCIYALILEGTRILEEKISPRSADIDVVWTNGYGFPRFRGGPMHYADEIGVRRVYEGICKLRDRFGPMYWEVPALLEELAAKDGKFSGL
ncbi:MAG: 3-hydroxyacyl-CoA dehydrogenase [Rhodospirillaceae bacterium]|nr:3-hydroxyacyl-CoA dehydrogenase [Rhodospirillaceae bacterium]